MVATKEKEKVEVEEAEVNAYMESVANEAPTNEEYIQYARARYDQIKKEYRALKLQKAEADARKSEDILNRITQAFRENFSARKWAVAELRSLGEEVNDPFIA